MSYTNTNYRWKVWSLCITNITNNKEKTWDVIYTMLVTMVAAPRYHSFLNKCEVPSLPSQILMTTAKQIWDKFTNQRKLAWVFSFVFDISPGLQCRVTVSPVFHLLHLDFHRILSTDGFLSDSHLVSGHGVKWLKFGNEQLWFRSYFSYLLNWFFPQCYQAQYHT